MFINVSERIKAVGEFVDTGRYKRVADIGCDHGYTSIFIAQRALDVSVIACDIRQMPLRAAECNIKKFGLDSRIETRLGGGLSPFCAGEIDCAVLSGMGGLLIIDILSEGKAVAEGLEQLVLQPQRDIYEVRKFLHKNNFIIADEKMVYEDGKYYTVLSAKKGIEKYNEEYDYIYGKRLIEKKHEVFKRYIEQTAQKEINIIEALKKSDSDDSKKRLDEVIAKHNITMEVYEWLRM